MRHDFQARMPEVADKIKFFIGDVRDIASDNGNTIKLGIRGFVRICIETCARGYFGAWKYRFRKRAC